MAKKRSNRQLFMVLGSVAIVFGLVCLLAAACGRKKEWMNATDGIRLSGKASGGTIGVLHTRGSAHSNICDYVFIETRAGESAASVARRLAQELVKNRSAGTLNSIPFDQIVEPTTLVFGGLGWPTLCGTEAGLGIPAPPCSLSASYDPEKKRYLFHWTEPEAGYGGGISWLGCTPITFDKPIVKERDEPAVFRAIVGWDYYNSEPGQVPRCIGTPSPPAGVYLCRNSQEELYSIPFSRGLAPNWLDWVHKGIRGKDLKLRQGTRKDALKKLEDKSYIKDPMQKPFYQIIRPKAAGVSGGIWRKFLGLTPGHKYRVSVILSTLKMHEAEGDWAFSFHATPDDAEGKDLTAEQMAGKTALPDGSKGPEAGRLVRYDADHTTEGKWIESTTAPGDRSPGRKIGDITLPEGVTSI
ncbi:MAG: hypothetical protein KGZ25_07795, partial [Planctomycetes bacterium]|nr:hypothetical protein [Planctomycetota bacterium]